VLLSLGRHARVGVSCECKMWKGAFLFTENMHATFLRNNVLLMIFKLTCAIDLPSLLRNLVCSSWIMSYGGDINF
jgi:hypothetical protein